MGMALATLADDRDLLALDEVQIGVLVVVNAHFRLRSRKVRRFRWPFDIPP
jgi:hypothetical protein